MVSNKLKSILFYSLIYLSVALATNDCVQKQCPRGGNGILLLPVENDCEKYIVCNNGRSRIRSCPDNHHFTEDLQGCIPATVSTCKECESDSEESEESMESINLENEATPHENNISQRCKDNSVTPVTCPQILPEDRLFPHPDDCELFYYCTTPGLPPICRDCPAGLHFNPVKKVCDHPQTAGCQIGGLEVKSEIDSLPTCNNHNGVWADLRPDPNDCSKYYVCDWGQLYHMDCPAGLHFNNWLKVCDLPQNARCENQTNPALSVEGLANSTLETCEDQNGEMADLRPNPENCNTYYVCDWGQLILMHCPNGMHFNAELQVCDSPQNARCENKLKNADDKQRSIVCNTNQDVGHAEIQPDPTSCTHFYICTWGEPIRKSCPLGLHFNPKESVCDYPNTAGCEAEGSIPN